MKEGVIEQSETGGALAILILAAGSSSRMGQSKQKLLIEGKALLVHAVETALKSKAGKVTVVLGSEEEKHRQVLKGLPIALISNPGWQAGMGSSLKKGLQHVMSGNPATEAILVMVCDQPLLQPDHLQSLVKQYRKTGSLIVASAYSNTAGVPAIFSHKLFNEILQLHDEEGAKKIIRQHAAATVDFPGGDVDLDTPEDYQNFLQQHSKKMS
jgi:molybdenum cofactor cytidylyltransferase